MLAKGDYNRPDESFPAGTYIELFRVTGTADVSRAEFGLAAKITRLTLAGENRAIFATSVRETSVFARSDLLPLAPFPVTTPIAGDRIPVAGAADGLLPGRRLIVRGSRVSGGAAVTVQAVLIAAHPVDAARTELEITPPLEAPLRRDSVIVHANVALATHGETATEILGSGNAAESFQRFRIRHQPLTWRAAETELGAAPELTVRVGDVAWAERPTLYGGTPTDHAYMLEVDAAGQLLAAFGDGTRGARLSTGIGNVRATLRKGLGAEGNVRAGTLTQPMTRPLGLKGASNPLPAEGGTDPEPPEEARQTIPLTTRTLGCAVSLIDYEDFARAYSGIAKARAAVLQLPAGPAIAVTLAAQKGRTLTMANPIWSRLLDALRAGGDPHVAVALLPYAPATFRLGLRLRRDPARSAASVLAAVEVALRARFGFDARALGQPVQQSEVIAVAQAVPGVVAVDLTSLWGGSSPLAQTLPSVPDAAVGRPDAGLGRDGARRRDPDARPRPARAPRGDVMTPSLTPERLYRLLPAIYRLRDAAAREPLRALVAAFAGEIAALEEDVAQLYDDQFIETCAPWVAPYIGDLVGYRPLHGVVPRVASPRAEVANTIAYRRRKGTALMLEQLAADVTGWPAHAVEFFERLATTQYMKHIRLHALATAELRDLTAAFAEGGACGRSALPGCRSCPTWATPAAGASA